MAKIGRPGLPEAERRRVWDLWKQGHSFSEISRAVGVPPGSVFSILKPRGGIYFPEPERRPGALDLAEREEISRGVAAGESLRHIAAGLGRPASTVSREINRNNGRDKYRAIDADDRAFRRAKRPQRLKLQKNPVLGNYVATRLEKCWSPEQIAGRLRRNYPANPRMHISHESIYRCVYLNAVRKTLPHRIHQRLRRGRPLRHGKHYSTRGQWRSQIKNARPISDRPAAAEHRRQPGHWEGDLIIGSNTSQVATLVDRADKTVHLVGLESRTAECLRTELALHLDSIPQLSMQTLTWDRGMEMAEHQEISKATGVGIYFADPHSPWQRGTNENTNGLIRQYLPKKTDLGRYSQDDLDAIAHQLNTRPRKSLNYQTPLEARDANVALTI